MELEKGSRQSVQSVERAFAVLRTFSPREPTLSVSEIASKVHLNRTTVHRLVVTLERCGVVRRDPITHKYMISAGVLEFSNVFSHVTDVRSIAQGPMVALRDATQQTTALHIREGNSRITIYQLESADDLRVTYPDIGVPIPLHLGAPGKAILAFLPSEFLDEFLQKTHLTQATEFSVTDPDRLRADLKVIRERGYALTEQERRPGVVSVAAPIFSRDGDVIASVNFSGSVHRVSTAQIEEYIPEVVHAADEVSRRLGYVGSVASMDPS